MRNIYMLNFLKEKDVRSRFSLLPVRIVWKSEALQDMDLEGLLSNPQKTISIKYNGDIPPAFVLDFGREIHGGIQLGQGMVKDKMPLPLKVTFGESVVEAMGEPDQDHAIHDSIVLLPWYGYNEVGTTGFRFVRIEMLKQGTEWLCTGIKAIVLIQDLEYLGNFTSSDEFLNKIWQTGAYTVHLCLQDYLWDGIKRDRLVWIGDMHVETVVLSHLFGYNATIEKSLDFVRDNTPLPGWMNGISSYSLWWIIIQEYWYFMFTRKEYLEQQRGYLKGLVQQMIQCVDESGKEILPETRFLDWSTAGNKEAIHSGLQSLLYWAFTCAESLLHDLKEEGLMSQCSQVRERMRKYHAPEHQVKQSRALGVIAGLENPTKVNEECFNKDPLLGLSTFYGFYVLQAKAMAGDLKGGLDLIRNYWGPMLKMGATTFWEHFDVRWLEGEVVPIDEVVPGGKKSIHKDFGEHCYVGLRHSLCHGWASGPTAWLIQHVLGIQPIAPSCKRIRLVPYLGDTIDFAEGTMPTPFGLVQVRHEKDKEGKIKTQFKAPKEVEIILAGNK